MKRMLLMLVTLMLLLPTVMVGAEETVRMDDSRSVSTEIYDLLEIPDDAGVTRLYKMNLVAAFAKSGTLDDLPATTDISEIYCVQMPDGTVKELLITDGVVWEADITTVNTLAMQFYKSDEVLELIGEDADVQNVYYLTGEIHKTGTAIYYRTSKGDYVYYVGIGAKEYFFTAEMFFDFMDAVYEEMIQDSGKMIGGMSVNENWDMSAFCIGSPTFNLNAQPPWTDDQPQNDSTWLWIGVAAVAAVAAAGGGVILWKKRKTA